MKLLSLDQSTRCSGYAVFKDGEYINSGVIDMTKSKLETDERSFEMAKQIWDVMKQCKPDVLVLENVQQQSNPKSMIVLARLAGMIVGYAAAHNVQIKFMLPSQWRKILNYSQGAGIKRQELKQQSINYIKENLGKELPEDECEAICIGIAAFKSFEE